MSNRRLLAVAALVLAGCVGTDVGNPQTSTQLGFVVPELQTHAQALMAEGWTVDLLNVYVDSLSIVTAGSSNLDIMVENAPVQIDLVAGSGLEFETTAESAQQLIVHFSRESAPWLEAELRATDGRVIRIEATNADRIRYSGEIPLHSGLLFSTHPVLPWLVEETERLSELTDDALISETNQPQLFRSFLRAFVPNAKLYWDEDRNLKLDDKDKNIAAPTL